MYNVYYIYNVYTSKNMYMQVRVYVCIYACAHVCMSANLKSTHGSTGNMPNPWEKILIKGVINKYDTGWWF